MFYKSIHYCFLTSNFFHSRLCRLTGRSWMMRKRDRIMNSLIKTKLGIRRRLKPITVKRKPPKRRQKKPGRRQLLRVRKRRVPPRRPRKKRPRPQQPRRVQSPPQSPPRRMLKAKKMPRAKRTLKRWLKVSQSLKERLPLVPKQPNLRAKKRRPLLRGVQRPSAKRQVTRRLHCPRRKSLRWLLGPVRLLLVVHHLAHSNVKPI